MNKIIENIPQINQQLQQYKSSIDVLINNKMNITIQLKDIQIKTLNIKQQKILQKKIKMILKQ